MHGPLHEDEIAARLGALSRWLLTHEPLWRAAPFYGLPVAWEADHPELSRWLRARSADEVDALEQDPRCMDAPACFTALQRDSQALDAVGPLAPAAAPLRLWDEAWGVPGRKASQIAAFAGVVGATAPAPTRVVDWCAGKAHLGRTLAGRAGAPVLAIERDAALVASGEAMAGSEAVRFVRADVLRDRLDGVLDRADLLVGLHACGALTDTALRRGAEAGVATMALVPCCFHRVSPTETAAGPPFTALSRAGRASGLRLDVPTLRLPAKVEAAASRGERMQRRRSTAWRLAVDLLLREATGEDRYFPVRQQPDAAMRGPFEAYARAAAEAAGYTLPGFDPAAAEAAGWERCRVVRALGLVAQPFRRPLALWWVADRALALAEAGRSATIGALCGPELTPRNLVLLSRARQV